MAILRTLPLLLTLLSVLTGQVLLDQRSADSKAELRADLQQAAVSGAAGRITVADAKVSVEWRLKLRNAGGSTLTAVLATPLAAAATPDTVRMDQKGSPVLDRVLTAAEAAARMRAAVKAGQPPRLLTLGTTASALSRDLTLPPAAETEIAFSYELALPASADNHALSIPLRRLDSGNSGGAWSCRAEIATAKPLGIVQAWNAGTQIERLGAQRAAISWAECGAEAALDFCFSTGSATPAVQILGCRDDAEGGSFAVLVGCPGAITTEPAPPRDVAIVADTSGSLQGARMQQLLGALRRTISWLRAEDRYALITYAAEARVLQALGPADEQRKQQALALIADLRAEGGTNLCAGLTTAVETLAPSQRQGCVILLAEGAPTVGVTASTRVLDRVQTANRGKARIFVLGLGESARPELLDNLADTQGGVCSQVRPGAEGSRSIEEFLGRVGEPALRGIRLEAQGMTLAHVLPPEAADLFAGSQLLLTGNWKGSPSGRFVLTATGDSKPVVQPVDFDAPQGGTDGISRLHAQRRLATLTPRAGEGSAVISEAREISERFALLTPWTATWLLPRGQKLAWESRGASSALRGFLGGTGQDATPPIIRAGGHTLLRNDSGWVEMTLSRLTPEELSRRLVRVVQGSAEWERTLMASPELSAVFALGPMVLVEHERAILQLVSR